MHQLFNNAKTDYIRLLVVKTFKKDDIVFNEGDLCNSIGLILSGELQISTITILESEYSISTISKDDLFGSTLLFSSAPYYLGFGRCLKETKIAFLSKDNLIYLLQNDEAILNNYLSFLSIKRLEIQERLKILCQPSIREKILFLIKSRMNNKKEIYFSSKEKMAKFLNIPRPSLSRELINMKKDHLIIYDKNKIRLL